MSTPTTPVPAPKSNKSSIIIAVLSIIVVLQSIKIYMDYQDKVEVREQLSNTEEELATTLQRLNEIKAELDVKIAEIQKLGGDVSELQKAKAEVEAELKRTRRADAKKIQELRDKVEGYEELLKIKDEELEKLKSVNQQLFTENRSLKTQQNKLSDSLRTAEQTKKELASKVALASQLKAENMNVWALNEKGKERESPFRARQIAKIKVEFTLADNKVAPIEGKKILVRITDDNGQVIFDVSRGSGTFILNGKEEFYTAAQEILFDNTRQKLTFFYEKGSDYPSGTYTVEAFTDSYSLGKAQFVVK
ncbi:MAG: chromosome segregation protein SMC [Cyclobacteriaceae bacterium]|jgi:regulator of replication initiation timing|nr:chromosome segregation protein SMC [Cyclobacteriaceae bacterium]